MGSLSNSYLKIAQIALLAEQKPMTAKSIIEFAIANEKLPPHLFGRTPHKTMQARLSEEILKNQSRSLFYRTGAGEFFLRELGGGADVPKEWKSEYIAPRRKMKLPNERVLVARRSQWEESGSLKLAIPASKFEQNELYELLDYKRLGSIKAQSDFIPVISFILVHKHSKVLSHFLGKFRSFDDPLSHKVSLGFGNYVLEQDSDITYQSQFGILESGILALSHGTGLPADLAERARYNNELIPRAYVQSKTHIGDEALFLVIDYFCPEEFDPGRPNLSFTGVRWLEKPQLQNDFSNFDPLSATMLEKGTGEVLSVFREPNDISANT